MEVFFYQLERQPLEKVLPVLLEKTLARGWRALVVSPDDERLLSLEGSLWTYSDESFLPHGLAAAPDPGAQPVLLHTVAENLNKAQVLFLLDGAAMAETDEFLRVVYLFTGHDEAMKSRARSEWKAVKERGLMASFWRQNEAGGWDKAG